MHSLIPLEDVGLCTRLESPTFPYINNENFIELTQTKNAAAVAAPAMKTFSARLCKVSQRRNSFHHLIELCHLRHAQQ
jgi:hypothetical protein